MTPGLYLSPVGTVHYLDDTGTALCGRYSPEAVDLRPAPAGATVCRHCDVMRGFDATWLANQRWEKKKAAERAGVAPPVQTLTEAKRDKALAARAVMAARREALAAKLTAIARRNPDATAAEVAALAGVTTRQARHCLHSVGIRQVSRDGSQQWEATR